LREIFNRGLGPGYKDRIGFRCFIDPNFDGSLTADRENGKEKPEKETTPPKRSGQLGKSTEGFFGEVCWVTLWQDGVIAVTKGRLVASFSYRSKSKPGKALRSKTGPEMTLAGSEHADSDGL
jgi:hypothetical protein